MRNSAAVGEAASEILNKIKQGKLPWSEAAVE
jgi:hypothetical protein